MRLGALLLVACVAPAVVLASQNQLYDAVDAFEAGDCRTAMSRSETSLRTLANRPEPYEILALCQARRGHAFMAVRAIREAVRREPGNWEFWYDRAILEAAAGLDPHGSARQARRHAPREPIVRRMLQVLRRRSAAEFGRFARRIAVNEGLSILR